ncbi:MAG: ferrous iron transporter B [Erysipelotrichales bacterium]|nr:ferrous iron transporter B [Erysipelotrichales bacterium]
MNIALVGNQNSGKSSLFNSLCVTKQKIGNWPGVTIEAKMGVIKNTKHNLIDLPGTYSLIPYSSEEEITTNYIQNNKIDLIINVIDVTILERSLYLTTQLKETGIPMILALNMCDLLDKEHLKIDIDELERILGIKVVKISSKTNFGITELINEINKDKFINKKIFIKHDVDIEKTIANRYNFIDLVSKKVLKKEQENSNNKLDKIFLHKYFGIPFFIIIMAFVYYLSTSVVGNTLSILVETILANLISITNNVLVTLGTSNWLISLICDGILVGVGSVLTFLPQLLVLFLCINILENTGYMSRIAMLLDKLFHWLGLSGKSLIPFIVGSGCSVPAIMTARTIDNKKEREKTIALTSFIPCSAKLPLIVLISSFFFPNYRGLVSVSLYFLAILLIIFLALLLKKRKNEETYFISELPKYQLPDFKYIFKDTLQKCWDFIKRAGSVILFSSIIIWCLAHVSTSFSFTNDISNSVLAFIGKSISFIFYPILRVNSWEASISAIQGIIAKEQVVASMEILASGNSNLFVTDTFNFFTPLTAFSFCVFNLFSAPCISAIATIKQELRSTKKMLIIVVLQTLFAYVLASLISLVGGLFL